MSELTWAERGILNALIALAGEIDGRDGDDVEDGRLDTPAYTAWRIRCDLSEFTAALQKFIQLNIVEERNGILYLVHFAEYQHRPFKCSFWSQIRLKILERDNWTCVYCGEPANHVDHVIPTSRGGDTTLENLVAACWHCNISKNNRTPSEWPQNPQKAAENE